MIYINPGEAALLNDALEALHAATGAEGKLCQEPANRGDDLRPDALVEITVDQQRIPFVVEVRKTDRLEILGHIKAQLDAWIRQRFPNHRPLLITPFMTRELAERCRAIDLPFLDTAGNVYLRANGVLLYVTGRPKPRQLERTAYRADTAAGLRLVFALLREPTLTTKPYREIADIAGIALGTIGPVLKDLEQRGFLRRGREQELKLVNGLRLLDEWLTHYPVVLRPKLHPRRYQADPKRLLQLDPARHEAYWGGEPAAERLTGFLKPEHYTLYTRGTAHAVLAEARIRADPNGNLELLEAFWAVATRIEKPGVAPPLVVYADLTLTREARNLEAAKLIYDEYLKPALGTE